MAKRKKDGQTTQWLKEDGQTTQWLKEKKDKRTNNDIQNTTQKTKDRVT
jgi:hypothetical protein